MKSEIVLPAPHHKQVPILASTARFKVVRAGRRFGKDRLALHAAVVGHGNGRWRGIAQGVDVAWVGPDYPQVRAIWREEVQNRFVGVAGVDLHQQERRVSLPGGGTLEFRSAENIDSLRGRKLGGAVINEAAYFDLEYALKEVIMPALMDLGGWVIIISTPNAGPDGHETIEGKRSPSYFNILCEQLGANELSEDWQHWHFTSRDNPKIPAAEVEALYAQYDKSSPQLAQELDAKLIVAGSGVAFPEWDEALHTTTLEPERHTDAWRWSAGMDWGYTKPGWFGLFASGSERSVCRWESYFRQTTPYQVGYNTGQSLKRFPRPEWVALDSAAFAVSDGGPTIAEEVQRGLKDACGPLAPPVIAAPKGPGSRHAGKMLVHEALRFTRNADGQVPAWQRPKLLVHTSCTNLIRTLPRLPLDPKGKDDVDTAAEDHAYDGLRYWLEARTPHVERERATALPPNVHPGLTKQGTRRREKEVAPAGGRYQRFNGQASGEWD